MNFFAPVHAQVLGHSRIAIEKQIPATAYSSILSAEQCSQETHANLSFSDFMNALKLCQIDFIGKCDTIS